mmetsp:Transcript_25334/g.55540  ORF Transcript_25334/g.55540 Transcript_25334/m.55540 type:complete len:1150 (-) Transcript_25334:172-3621(-)
MVKSKFSSLDVRAMVNSVRAEVLGCKLTNVYDINSRVYILKLARTNHKRFLLLESGVRFHLTNYERDKAVMPSNYTMKLRKHIRTKRLTDIRQIGTDRVVDLTFGYGEASFHLILELYVSGNLILTDHEYRIVVLLRAHSDQQSKVTVKSIYPLQNATGLLTVPIDEFEDEMQRLLDVAADREMNQLDQEDDKEEQLARQVKKTESVFSKRSKKRVQHDAFPMPQLLHKLAPFADPALCAASITAAMQARGAECANAFKLTVQDLSFDVALEVLKESAENALAALRSISRPGDFGGGDLLPVQEVLVDENEEDDLDEDDEEKEKEKADETKQQTESSTVTPTVPGWIVRKRVHIPPAEPNWTNDEFTALRPASTVPEALLSFTTFHRCVDEFYTQLEENKAQEVKAQHAQSVFAKVEKIKTDQGRRIGILEAEQQVSERQANLIETHVGLVDLALAMLNAMIASQVDWGDMWREVKRQQRLGHPIAQHIHSLDLEHNQFRFLLGSQPDDADDLDADDDRPMEVVTLDLSLSAQKNVARLHSLRKQTKEKTTKTVSQAEVAIKQAEKRAQKDIQKFQFKQTIRKVRQTWWFEKYLWFISSENYLVLAGRDTLQTELLFTRHMAAKDVFVQADVAGARTCFIKNPEGGEVPPATLREAGTMSLCHSSAWDKRMLISAWWVFAEQACRGEAPSSTDSKEKVVFVDDFYVSGHRRFLPPLHLEMGFTLLFCVAEPGATEHKGERKSRYLELMGGCTPSQQGGVDEEEEEAIVPSSDDEEAEEVDRHNTTGDAGQGCSGDDGKRTEETAVDEEKDPGLEEEDEEEEEGPDLANARAVQDRETAEEGVAHDGKAGRQRVSKAERRRQKKGQGGAQEDPESSGRPAGEEEQVSAAASTASPVAGLQGSEGKQAKTTVVPRGQRSKVKKMKAKYGDQDEDDREFCLALLGSKAPKWAAAASAASASTEASPPAAVQQGGEDAEALEPSQSSPLDAEGANKQGAERASGSGQGSYKRQPKKPIVHQSVGCDADAATVDMQLDTLYQLTGQPSAEDDVLYVVPMVAPYCALGGPYTWRVKLTPGPSRKGQTARMCLKMVEAQLDRAAWRQLLQAIPENEVAMLMCGSAKLSMPGMQKLQQLMRREKQKEVKAKEGAADN